MYVDYSINLPYTKLPDSKGTSKKGNFVLYFSIDCHYGAVEQVRITEPCVPGLLVTFCNVVPRKGIDVRLPKITPLVRSEHQLTICTHITKKKKRKFLFGAEVHDTDCVFGAKLAKVPRTRIARPEGR